MGKLTTAVEHNDLKRVLELLNSDYKNSALINTELGADGNNALFNAVHFRSSIDIVKALVNHGADVNVLGGDGVTVLWSAVDHEDLDVIQLLLSLKPDVNKESGYFHPESPLSCAAGRGNIKIMTMLIAAGAKLQPTGQGLTPLNTAAFHGSVHAIELLTLLIPNPPLIDALYHAIINRKTAAVEYLVLLSNKKGVNLNHYSSYSQTLLYTAAKIGYDAVIPILVKAGAEVNNPGTVGDPATAGWTPLHIAAHKGHSTTIDELMKHGAQLTLRTQVGQTAVDVAQDVVSDLVRTCQTIEFKGKRAFETMKAFERHIQQPGMIIHSKGSVPHVTTTGCSLHSLRSRL